MHLCTEIKWRNDERTTKNTHTHNGHAYICINNKIKEKCDKKNFILNEHVFEFFSHLLCDLVFESKSFSFFFCCPFRLIGLWVSTWFIVSSAFNSSSSSSSKQKESHLKQKETTLNIHIHTEFLVAQKSVCGYFKSQPNQWILPLHFQLKRWRKSSFFFFHFHRVASTRVPPLIMNMKKKECTHRVYQRCFLMYTAWTRNGSRKQSFSSEMMNF